MKYRKELSIMTLIILILSLISSLMGIMPGDGIPTSVTSLHGETYELFGRGIYAADSFSYAVQARAQDWITLVIGIPLLLLGLILARRNSFRGKMIFTGTLGYFLYTYMSYSFLVSYNQLFLIYVTLFSLSLFSFILAFVGMDITLIHKRISEKFPHKTLGIFFIFIGTMLIFLWMGRLLPSLDGETVPFGLEIYTTLVIQAMDLALIVPAAFISGIALLKRKPIGYALGSIIVVKGLTLFSAVSMMGFSLYRSGIEVSSVELLIFPISTLINLYFAFILIKNMGQNS